MVEESVKREVFIRNPKVLDSMGVHLSVLSCPNRPCIIALSIVCRAKIFVRPSLLCNKLFIHSSIFCSYEM